MNKRLRTLFLMGFALLLAFSNTAFTLQKGNGKDHNPPTVVLSMPAPTGNNGWYNQPVQIIVKAWDGEKGVSNVQISLGGGTWYKRSLTIRRDGTYYVIGRATDKAGNMASVTEIVKVDLTPPVVEFNVPENNGLQNWYVAPVSLALNGSDALSGVYKTTLSALGAFDRETNGLLDSREIYLDGQDRIDEQILVDGKDLNATSAYIRMAQSGDYIVSGYVEDIAGNRTPVEAHIVLDLDAPQVAFEAPGQYYGEIELVGSAVDSDSGIAGVWVDSGTGWKRADVEGKNWSILWPTEELKDDVYTIHARVLDKAGNISENITRVTVLNHFWPIAAVFGLLISLGLVAMYDPRRKALLELTHTTAKYAHMDGSARRLERKQYD